MKFQTAYMKKEDQARPTIDCITEETPVITEQAHKKETDINWLLKDYMKTGLMKHAKNYEGQYDDVSAIDFENAMNTVSQSRSATPFSMPIASSFGMFSGF